MEMSFEEAVNLFRNIYHRFEKVEGRPWGVNGAMIEYIFGQLIRIADHYNINLLEAHIAAREDEDTCLKRMGV